MFFVVCTLRLRRYRATLVRQTTSFFRRHHTLLICVRLCPCLRPQRTQMSVRAGDNASLLQTPSEPLDAGQTTGPPGRGGGGGGGGGSGSDNRLLATAPVAEAGPGGIHAGDAPASGS